MVVGICKMNPSPFFIFSHTGCYTPLTLSCLIKTGLFRLMSLPMRRNCFDIHEDRDLSQAYLGQISTIKRVCSVHMRLKLLTICPLMSIKGFYIERGRGVVRFKLETFLLILLYRIRGYWNEPFQ